MYLGSLPVLTKGPFALMFGGSDILPHLSQLPPGRGLPVLILISTLFHASLFCVKKLRKNNNNYMSNLRSTLVENVSNVYGFISTIVISVFSIGLISQHMLSVKRNLEQSPASLSPLLPDTVIWIFCVVGFVTLMPFISKHALRSCHLPHENNNLFLQGLHMEPNPLKCSKHHPTFQAAKKSSAKCP